MRSSIIRLVVAVAFISPAMAQQPSPSQLALQINEIIGKMAQTIEQQQKQIQDLQNQLASIKKEDPSKQK